MGTIEPERPVSGILKWHCTAKQSVVDMAPSSGRLVRSRFEGPDIEGAKR